MAQLELLKQTISDASRPEKEKNTLAPQAANDLAVRSSAGSKSPSAFKTISEVAAELDVPQHVLRFWESKFPQIKPLKRKGGRRYYRPDDVAIIRRIQWLLYAQGFTIKGAKKVIDDFRDGDIKAAPVEQGAEQAGAAQMGDVADVQTKPGSKAKATDEVRVRRELQGLHDDLCNLRELLKSGVE